MYSKGNTSAPMLQDNSKGILNQIVRLNAVHTGHAILQVLLLRNRYWGCTYWIHDEINK